MYTHTHSLTHTLMHLPPQTFLDPCNNFSTYRHALVSAIAQANKSREKICVVPFFSLLVKDIYFLNEGLSNRYTHTHTRTNTHYRCC